MHPVIAALILTARFYSIVDVPVADRAAAAQVAGKILHSAGIDVRWIDCSERSSSADRGTKASCFVPLADGEVIVRFVASPAAAARRGPARSDALGDAYVDTVAATGALATVYVDRVAAMSRAAGVDAATLLGRVMAHEIGHLLLGSAVHRSDGLMRAEWSTTLLQRGIATDWRLSPLDAASVRAAVLKHARAASAPSGHLSATLPCAAVSNPIDVICPTCPVCAMLLPADRMPFGLLVEPRF
jgi:hypothetical protein